MMFDLIETLLIKCYEKNISPLRYFSKEFILSIISYAPDDVRLWLAKSMVHATNINTAVCILSKLIQDNEELVRIEAADSLGVFISEDSFEILSAATFDSSKLVRAYAYSGIAEIAVKCRSCDGITILHEALDRETEPRVLLDVYAGLYLLGEKVYLWKIHQMFEESDYRTKCATLYTLEDLATPENIKDILSFLGSQSEKKLEVSVASTFKTVFNHLNNKFKGCL